MEYGVRPNENYQIFYTRGKKVFMGDILNLVIDAARPYLLQVTGFAAAVYALQIPQTWTVLRAINSALLSGWRLVRRKPSTFAGKWLGVCNKRIEMISSTETTINELTGSIKMQDTQKKYKFVGHHIFDEIIGYYWPVIGKETDIGMFRLKQSPNTADILIGKLSFYESATGTVRDNSVYTWYRRPKWWEKWCYGKVKAGESEIDGTGLISRDRFDPGDKIGRLKLGKEVPQGQHTVLINGRHFLVEEPWKFINFSHDPNARIEITEGQMDLIARKEILPQAEITCDYKELDNSVSQPFNCNCQSCRERKDNIQV